MLPVQLLVHFYFPQMHARGRGRKRCQEVSEAAGSCLKKEADTEMVRKFVDADLSDLVELLY